ncbi:hypothetical protein N7481_010063 [Penicillium waksmanii]|uniref:uncharacterized protein n=1 Tax=Penicillium waksmanii TaxID=69791 RepID=UPI0025481932|nr:uncharacterized protein N7481_010063 [Penicillium waksmanii]KAJ5976356.1 hypothetical protein N7481_010063 [Penicillium waksmanii]
MPNLPGLLAEASRLHSGMKCRLPNDSPLRGGTHDVFKLEFADSTEWALRICRDAHDWPAELRAVKTLQHIKRHHPHIRAPTVHGTKHPVWFMDWMDGDPLSRWDLQIPIKPRQDFLEDLAEFLLLLWSTPAPALPYPTPVVPYSKWLTQAIDRQLNRTLSGESRWGDAMEYLVMRSMIPYYSVAVDEYSSIGIAHGDLNVHNILVDLDLRLSGVIDWDWLYLGPLPSVIHHPWFMADIPGWKNDWVQEGQNFEQDREYLEGVMRKKEEERKLDSTVSTLLHGSKDRMFFQAAISMPGIHEQFVETHCARTDGNMAIANQQLQAVLTIHPGWEKQPGVQRIRQMMKEV